LGQRTQLWYRPARWANRTKPEGWLPPSVQHRVDHVFLGKKIDENLPDYQNRNRTSPIRYPKNAKRGNLRYQQGTLAGYEIREYLLEKWGRKCVYCDDTNVPLQIEHVLAKSKGGTDRVGNLAIACETCTPSQRNRLKTIKTKTNCYKAYLIPKKSIPNNGSHS
jgi:hypothetical protein